MCHSLSFNKVVGLLFIKKETLAQVVFIKKTASIDKESYESCKAYFRDVFKTLSNIYAKIFYG